jgi:hypothetical protein
VVAKNLRRLLIEQEVVGTKMRTYPSPSTRTALEANHAHGHRHGGSADAHHASGTRDGNGDGADVV